MAKKIDSDLINRRLRGGQNSVHQGRARAPETAEAEESEVSKGFIAAVAVLFLAVSGGIYYAAGSGLTLDMLMNGETSKAFASSADPACKGLWVPSARNGPAIYCYMTREVSRLCDKRERRHFARVMTSYRQERLAYDSKLVFGGLQAVAVMKTYNVSENMTSMTSAVHNLSKEDATLPSASELTAIDSHFDMLKKMTDASADADLEAAMRIDQVPDERLVETIRGLGEAGYITKSDFGWFPDELVTAAFEGLKPAEPACKG
jgi:hypothetical protein